MTDGSDRQELVPGSTEAEIASQPDCWRRAAALAPDLARLLPAPGERVAVVGCGTSWFIAQSFAAAREITRLLGVLGAGGAARDSGAAGVTPP